jgi:hypothetical protein
VLLVCERSKRHRLSAGSGPLIGLIAGVGTRFFFLCSFLVFLLPLLCLCELVGGCTLGRTPLGYVSDFGTSSSAVVVFAFAVLLLGRVWKVDQAECVLICSYVEDQMSDFWLADYRKKSKVECSTVTIVAVSPSYCRRPFLRCRSDRRSSTRSLKGEKQQLLGMVVSGYVC